MDENIKYVLTGILKDVTCLDYFSHKNYPTNLFSDFNKRTNLSHGSRDARILADINVKYYEEYHEVTNWIHIEKKLFDLKYNEERIAILKKLHSECLDTLITRGEWRSRLNELVAEYRCFKHKDIMCQSVDLYELTCLGNHGSRGDVCVGCNYNKECKELGGSKHDRSTWLLDWTSNGLEKVKTLTNATDMQILDVGTLLDEAINVYETERNQESKVGIPTPFPSLTKLLGGWMEGRLYMIWARTGQGKSAFLLQCATEAVNNGYSVLDFNLEMPTKEELIHRIAAYVAQVEFDKLMKRQIDDTLMSKINASLTNWKSTIKDPTKYQIIDLPKQTKITTIYKCIEKHIAKYGRKLLVVIDYFGLLDVPTGKDATQEYASMAEGLHSFARYENIPILSAGQLNRSADGARRITPKHTRDCDKIIDNTDGSFALVPLTGEIARLQSIKGRYFACKDILLEKHLWRMGFAEHVGNGTVDADDDDEGGVFN